MSLINKRSSFLIYAACVVFLSQLHSTIAYGQDSYIEALANVAGESYVRSDKSINQLQVTNVDENAMTEYKSLLFKISSDYYHSFLDLGRVQQNKVLKTYTSTSSMESSIDTLLALSGVY